MGTYFLDTSAVIKRYVTETGSEWMKNVCLPSANNTIIVAQATLVEAVATFCRKAREQHLSGIGEAERDQIINRFRRDAQRQYNIVRVISTTYTQAGNLCRSHKLRAYDAIQLACALKVRTTLTPLNVTPIFVSADIGLFAVAYEEGMSIENPNVHS